MHRVDSITGNNATDVNFGVNKSDIDHIYVEPNQIMSHACRYRPVNMTTFFFFLFFLLFFPQVMSQVQEKTKSGYVTGTGDTHKNKWQQNNFVSNVYIRVKKKSRKKY